MDTFYNISDTILSLMGEKVASFKRATILVVNDGEERTARFGTSHRGFTSDKKFLCYPQELLMDVYAASFFGGNSVAAYTAYRAFAAASAAGYDHWRH
jgi:hypothetical protein